MAVFDNLTNDKIENIAEGLGTLYVIKTVSKSYSINNGEVKNITANVTPDSGYAVVGIVGFSSGGVLSPTNVKLQNSTTCRADFYNVTGGTQSATFEWKVLTIKKSFL